MSFAPLLLAAAGPHLLTPGQQTPGKPSPVSCMGAQRCTAAAAGHLRQPVAHYRRAKLHCCKIPLKLRVTCKPRVNAKELSQLVCLLVALEFWMRGNSQLSFHQGGTCRPPEALLSRRGSLGASNDDRCAVLPH